MVSELLSQLTSKIKEASDLIWGPYVLIPLLLFTGLFLTLVLRGLQFTKLWHSLYVALIVRREPGGKGDISHFQALMTALSATVGTGNIVGVATAIAVGGPGALFWMWMTGLVGMATKYSEALLSVKYRMTNPKGNQCGGPMYYLSKAIRWPILGQSLGILYAFFASVAAFGIGNMVQSNSVADALRESFQVPEWASGLAMAILAGAVIVGGIKWIGRFTGFFVPFMILIYIGISMVLFILHLERIPDAFALVFQGAFTETAASGGFTGALVAQAMRQGVARGIFSNESGLGSAGMAAAAAQTAEPVRQSLVSMTQTFIDTILVCTMTGIAIVATGAWTSGLNGAPLSQLAYGEGLPGSWGGYAVAVCLSMFAFSTILGWSYYGERSIEFLLGTWAIFPYRILFVLATFGGAVYTLDFVWNLSDLMNALMAIPNLLGLILLYRVITRETREFFQREEGFGTRGKG